MSMTSYAYNFEDVLLMRALGHLDGGRYLDGAAGDPLHGNATQAFYERGWHGVNLETSPTLLKRLRVARPADVNLALAPAAEAGERAWYEVDAAGASTFDAAQAQRQRDAGRAVVRHTVALQTLETVWADHIDGELHFLRLADGAALAALDLQRRRPWIVVLRSAAGAAPAAPLPVLQGARYRLAYADGYQQFYVAEEHADLAVALALPPNPADDFVLSEDHHYSYPLAGWRRRTAEAEAEAQTSRVWAQAHVREWREKFDRFEHQRARAEQAEEQLAQASARLQAVDSDLATTRDSLRAAETRLAAEGAESAALAVRARAAETQLHAVYASRSWQITIPLRKANGMAQGLRGWLRALPGRAVRWARRRARGLAGAALRYVNARPRLSFFLRRNIARLPFMVPVMRALKMRLQLNQAHAPAAAAAPVPADLDHLPDAARQVFDDLRRARRQAPHS